MSVERTDGATTGRPITRMLRTARDHTWALISPVASLITPLGYLATIAAIVSLVLGFWFGWIELTAIGFTLAVLCLAAAAFVFGRAQLRVRIELNPRRVSVGEHALGQMLVENTGHKRLPKTRMELPVGESLTEFAVPALAPGESHEELFAVPTTRRAVILAGPALSVRGDQLRLLRRAQSWTGIVELFVHPKTVRLSPTAAGIMHDLEGASTANIVDSDMAFHALREYTPGDDMRHVHWKSSARAQTLLVRQFEESRRSRLALLLQTDRAHYSSDNEFEIAISAAASIASQLIRSGNEISVATEHRLLETRNATALLDDCSRIEPEQTPFATMREFARHTCRYVARPTVALVIGGDSLEPAQLQAARTVFPPEARIVGLRVSEGAEPALVRASRVTIVTVGSLEDVPAALERIAA